MSIRQSTGRKGRVRAGVAALGMITLFAAACSDGVLTPSSGRLIGDNLDGRASGPSGLEQRLVTKVDPAPAGSPYTALLTVTSTVVNTGSAPVRLTSRVCYFQQADVETAASLDRFEPTISCAAVSATSDLAPGQSTGPMAVEFGVRSGPGTYTVKLRHALNPEFRAEASFRIP
jgi:hypothetical protein